MSESFYTHSKPSRQPSVRSTVRRSIASRLSNRMVACIRSCSPRGSSPTSGSGRPALHAGRPDPLVGEDPRGEQDRMHATIRLESLLAIERRTVERAEG